MSTLKEKGKIIPEVKVKINPKDNTITIHPIEKYLITLEQLREVHYLEKAFNKTASNEILDKWIEKNLTKN